MKHILTTLLFLFTLKQAYTQDYVYKRIPYGEVEVYQGWYGSAQGLPIGKFKKDLYGNVQYFSLDANTQPSNQPALQPVLVPVHPQLASISSILNCLNAYYQVLKKQREQQMQRNYSQSGVNALKINFEQMNSQFEQLKKFYTQVINKPSKVNDGWHNVTVVEPNVINDLINKNINIDAKYLVKTGYAFVNSNKIQSLILTDYSGGANFEKPYIISNSIEACKAFYKLSGSTGPFNNEVYFLDYILDSTTQVIPPQLGSQRFVLGNNVTKAVVGVYKNDPAIYGDGGDNWIGMLILIKSKQGEQAAALSQFISLPGKYYYYIEEINNHKWTGSFILTPNCENTVQVTY